MSFTLLSYWFLKGIFTLHLLNGTKSHSLLMPKTHNRIEQKNYILFHFVTFYLHYHFTYVLNFITNNKPYITTTCSNMFLILYPNL